MSRRTFGIRTVVVSAGVASALGLFITAGCAQQQAATQAAQAVQLASAAVTSVAGGQSHASTTNPRYASGIKLNGRGGFDASQAQKNALARAHYIRDHHNDVFKPYRPSTQPTSQPSPQPTPQPTTRP